jgi:RNA polymerase sigma factor (sigma-70 family)
LGQRRHRAILGAIDQLFRKGTATGLSDGELLDRFASRHDEAAEAAFAALVERHGPMVWRVCRRVLGDPHEAADAFQATFLILVRKPGAIRARNSLASWFYGVALRVAAHSRAAEARRRAVEQAAGSPSALARPAVTESSLQEVWDEVERLPERFRTAVVLCYLEGLTHEQAARRIGCPVGTVRSRLARARDRLRRRLAARGLAPEAGSAALAGLVFGTCADASPLAMSLPLSLVEPTVKAALLVAAHDAAEAGLVSLSAAALAEGVLRTMFLAKLKSVALALSLILLAAGGVAGLGAYGYQVPALAPASLPVAVDPNTSAQESPAEPAARAEPAQAESDLEKAHAHQLALYAEQMTALVRQAHRQQNKGDLQAAAETTRKIQQVAQHWSYMLDHPDAVAPPYPSYSTTPRPQGQPGAAFNQPLSPVPELAPRVDRQPRTGATLDNVPQRALGPAPGTAGPGQYQPFSERPNPGAVASPAQAVSNTDRRLDALERKLDRVLQALDPGTSQRVDPVPPAARPVPTLPEAPRSAPAPALPAAPAAPAPPAPRAQPSP